MSKINKGTEVVLTERIENEETGYADEFNFFINKEGKFTKDLKTGDIFSFEHFNKDDEKFYFLTSSEIEKIEDINNYLIITTKNSIYKFKKTIRS